MATRAMRLCLREREELPGFCLLELSGAEFQKELKDRAMARARARA